DRRNALLNITGEVFWGLQANLVLASTVLVVLLKHFGAGKDTIGYLPAIEGIGLLLPQALGVYLFRNARTRKMRIIWWHYLCMIPFLLLLGLSVLTLQNLSANVMIVLLLGCWGLYLASMGVVGAAWQDWIAHLFHQRIRGTVTGLSWGMSAVAGVISPLAAGWAIGHFPQPQVQGWLYIVAAAIAYLSISVFLFIRDPAADWHQETGLGLRDLLTYARQSLHDRGFRTILIGRSLTGAGFAIGPFVTVYFLSEAGGQLTESTVTALAAAQTVGSAIACIAFGRIGDRLGHRFGVLCGAALQVAGLTCVLLIPGRAGCITTNLCLGLVNGILTISSMNLWLESCPHRSRAAHIVLGNLVLMPILAIVPILGGQLANRAGLTWLFAASLFLSLLALIWIALFVREPRKLRTEMPDPMHHEQGV
ncbi:MAG: MFS transporter, partial [Phycisphaerae bacterium]